MQTVQPPRSGSHFVHVADASCLHGLIVSLFGPNLDLSKLYAGIPTKTIGG